MRIQEKLDNLVRLVTGNKFGAADEYINQIKNEYNQMAHERDQYNEKAENEKLAREYALKYAEKLDEKVDSQAEIIEGFKEIVESLEKVRDEYKGKAERYDAMFNQPMKLSVPNDTQVERLVPFSELERERLNFELLEKAILDANQNNHASTIFTFYHLSRKHHQLRQEGDGE